MAFIKLVLVISTMLFSYSASAASKSSWFGGLCERLLGVATQKVEANDQDAKMEFRIGITVIESYLRFLKSALGTRAESVYWWERQHQDDREGLLARLELHRDDQRALLESGKIQTREELYLSHGGSSIFRSEVSHYVVFNPKIKDSRKWRFRSEYWEHDAGIGRSSTSKQESQFLTLEELALLYGRWLQAVAGISRSLKDPLTLEAQEISVQFLIHQRKLSAEQASHLVKSFRSIKN